MSDPVGADRDPVPVPAIRGVRRTRLWDAVGAHSGPTPALREGLPNADLAWLAGRCAEVIMGVGFADQGRS